MLLSCCKCLLDYIIKANLGNIQPDKLQNVQKRGFWPKNPGCKGLKELKKKIQELSCCGANCLVPNCRFWCHELRLELWWTRFPHPALQEKRNVTWGRKFFSQSLSYARARQTVMWKRKQSYAVCRLWNSMLNETNKQQRNEESTKQTNQKSKSNTGIKPNMEHL